MAGWPSLTGGRVGEVIICDTPVGEVVLRNELAAWLGTCLYAGFCFSAMSGNAEPLGVAGRNGLESRRKERARRIEEDRSMVRLMLLW